MNAPAAAPDDGEPAAPPELLGLRSAQAVRERCAIVHRWVAQGHSRHFALDEDKLDATAELVADTTRSFYPDLAIPHHSRWRHFSAGDLDRWSALPLAGATAIAKARAAVDLTFVSVLLDAGAGAAWRYRDAQTGLGFARSEGLAIASFDMFGAGLFSSDPSNPLQVDSAALVRLDLASLASAFQASDHNPLVGLPHRLTLLRRFGEALAQRPDLFGGARRPGHLVDAIVASTPANAIAAADILVLVLDAFSAIWPSGLTVDGVPLGDAGRHRAIRTQDRSDTLVPFHKLSQWLTYSLIEPIGLAGLTVVDIDGLTALPEYRNGGLLVDTGVIRPRAPLDSARPYEVASEFIVEWRALTVALMDRLREATRQKLGIETLSMSQLLQGGTWSAGRAIAAQLRPPDGPPPIAVNTDGT
ncbi:MAG TPA: URC4/urg3 family protein, partial [Xanthobacteraceae bacterium]